MTVTVTFLGAAGTVTGSKYLVQGKRAKILVDAGLFQGSRKWREKNWDTPPCDLSDIDAVLLTHAHIDHIGILPRFSILGFTVRSFQRGLPATSPVFCCLTALVYKRKRLNGGIKKEKAAIIQHCHCTRLLILKKCSARLSRFLLISRLILHQGLRLSGKEWGISLGLAQ